MFAWWLMFWFTLHWAEHPSYLVYTHKNVYTPKHTHCQHQHKPTNQYWPVYFFNYVTLGRKYNMSPSLNLLGYTG